MPLSFSLRDPRGAGDALSPNCLDNRQGRNFGKLLVKLGDDPTRGA